MKISSRQLPFNGLVDGEYQLYSKGMDVLSQDLLKFRSREIGCYKDRIAIWFDKRQI